MSSPTPEKTITFEKVGFDAELPQVTRILGRTARRGHLQIHSFSADSKLVVGVTQRLEDPGGTGHGKMITEIWVSDPEGRKPRPLLAEEEKIVSELRASPYGNYVAYSTIPTEGALDRDSSWKLWVLRTTKPKKWLVADRGAQLPQWSPDGTRLFYWRKESDAVYSREKGLVSEAKWKLHYTVGPWHRPKIKVAVQATPRKPMGLSPDAKRLAFFVRSNARRRNAVVVQRLDSGQRIECPLLFPSSGGLGFSLGSEQSDQFVGYDNCESIRWSADSRCVLIALNHWDGGDPDFYLLETSTQKFSALNSEIAASFRDVETAEQVTLRTVSWIGRGRLLVAVTVSKVGSLSMDMSPATASAQWKWIVYDWQSKGASPVEGLPEKMIGRPSLNFSADGSLLALSCLLPTDSGAILHESIYRLVDAK